MNTYYAKHELFARGSSFDCYCLVIICETESVALGMALERYPDTTAKDWEITHINSDERCVFDTSWA